MNGQVKKSTSQEPQIFPIQKSGQIANFKALSDALHLWLRLTRETGDYQPQTAKNGFYQGEATDAHIIRLAFSMEDGVYPMISGHKNRFAIKFLDFESNQASTQDIAFKIAVCN